MATIHLGRKQYRDFAEQTKTVGCGLTLSTAKALRGAGTYSPWALLICKDTTANEYIGEERSLISLAAALNPDTVRSWGESRPELDYGKLKDNEIYPFIVAHEIGHRVSNFSMTAQFEMERSLYLEAVPRMRYVNEVLADRFAWETIRPGKAIPLNQNGRMHQDRISDAIEFLDSHHIERTLKTLRPLQAGQYYDVPDDMLTADKVGYIGPRVSKSLLRLRESERQ